MGNPLFCFFYFARSANVVLSLLRPDRNPRSFMKSKPHCSFFALALLALSTQRILLSPAEAQGTAFTYQGQLNVDGVPASGFYDFQFSLYNSPQLSPGGTQIGSTLTNLAVGVTNGAFTASLDFGAVLPATRCCPSGPSRINTSRTLIPRAAPNSD